MRLWKVVSFSQIQAGNCWFHVSSHTPSSPLHPQYDPVTAVIAHVHREQAFLQAIRFAKIELSQTALGLDQLGELNVPDELYLHKRLPLKKLISDLN